MRPTWSVPTLFQSIFVDDDPTLSVAEAARLLGRDRTRIYALLRYGHRQPGEAAVHRPSAGAAGFKP